MTFLLHKSPNYYYHDNIIISRELLLCIYIIYNTYSANNYTTLRHNIVIINYIAPVLQIQRPLYFINY